MKPPFLKPPCRKSPSNQLSFKLSAWIANVEAPGRLIHARFILTSRGMAAMLDKYNCYVRMPSDRLGRIWSLGLSWNQEGCHGVCSFSSDWLWGDLPPLMLSSFELSCFPLGTPWGTPISWNWRTTSALTHWHVGRKQLWFGFRSNKFDSWLSMFTISLCGFLSTRPQGLRQMPIITVSGTRFWGPSF